MEPELPSTESDPDMLIQPTKVLSRVFRQKAGATTLKVQVHWDDESSALVMLEDEQDLRRKFPEAPAWGQAASQQGGYVVMPRDMRRRRRKQVWKARCTTSDKGSTSCG